MEAVETSPWQCGYNNVGFPPPSCYKEVYSRHDMLKLAIYDHMGVKKT